MNSVAHPWRMTRLLLLTPQNIINFLIFAPAVTFNASIVGGWWALLLVVIYPVLRPTWEPYAALGLTRATWRRHRRLAVTAVVPLLLIEVALLSTAEPRWVLPASILALWLIAMVWPGQPTRSMEELIAAPETRRSSARAAIIYRPQALAWLVTWGLGLATFLILAVLLRSGTSFVNGEMHVRFFVWVAIIVGSCLSGMGAIGRSLRDWQSLGGTRKEWAGSTALAGLTSVAFGVLIAAFDYFLLLPGHAGGSLGFVLMGFFAPLIACTLELSDRQTWWITVLFLAAAGGVVLLAVLGLINVWIGVAGAAVLYLVFSALLPTMARRFTPYGGGMSNWLGLNARTA
ncbi:hypothetical protein [Corynebacterium testudinoris]|uniref:Uncharacterized protein n=1 Tax=Corynebacterium testudinoris TaxID=136857 RepID=A0A0G3HD92_9CORY|nr:hypothetical protein [Corynebacterium testudinoris]AKK09938.1 hypothetical protein CTEST_12675 [Corynebacterium testudinoris]